MVAVRGEINSTALRIALISLNGECSTNGSTATVKSVDLGFNSRFRISATRFWIFSDLTEAWAKAVNYIRMARIYKPNKPNTTS